MFSQNLIFVRCPFEERKIPPLIFRRDYNIMWWSSQWLKSQFHQLKNCEWLNPCNLQNTYHTKIKLFDQLTCTLPKYSIETQTGDSHIQSLSLDINQTSKGPVETLQVWYVWYPFQRKYSQHLIWIYSIYPLRDYSYIINIKIRVRPPLKQMTHYCHRCMDLSAGSTIGMSLRILEKPEHLIESCLFVICFQEFWKI